MNRLKKFLVKGLVISSALALLPTAFAMKEEKPKKLDPFSAQVVSEYLKTFGDEKNLVMCNKKFREILERYRYNSVPLTKKQFLKLEHALETYHVYGKANEFKPLSFDEVPNNIFKIVYEPGSFDPNLLTHVINTHRNRDEGCKISVDKFVPGNECLKFGNDVNKDYGFKVILTTSDGREIEFRVNLEVLMINDGCISISRGVNEYNNIVNFVKPLLPPKYELLLIDGTELLGGIKEVRIPKGVTHVGSNCFLGCKSLTKIEIPEGVTFIGSNCFLGCKSLTKINIPNSVTEIGDECFRNCGNLTTINIPEGVTSIGNNCFEGCASLTTINIPNSVTSIGNCCFKGCTGLTTINIPNSVTSISPGCFNGCEGLTTINIPNSVTSIGNFCFWGCRSLTTINIPNSVTNIGNCCFYGCGNLTTINIPNSVTGIRRYCFNGCGGELIIIRDGKKYTIEEFKKMLGLGE